MTAVRRGLGLKTVETQRFPSRPDVEFGHRFSSRSTMFETEVQVRLAIKSGRLAKR